MDFVDAAVTEYLLATDYNGAPFRAMAAASMKAQYPTALLQKLYDGLLTSDEAMNQAQQSQSAMDQAQENIETAKQARAQAAESGSETAEVSQEAATVENPIDIVKAIKNTDILTLVMPSGSTVSGKEIRNKKTLEERQLCQGNRQWQKNGDWYESVLYQQFLQTRFSCYEAGKSNEGALDYELEYIHAGKKTDRDNLKSVVRQLLLLREGANYLYLQTDTVKQQEAYGVAAAIAAALGIAPAVGLIAQGILAAWAYAESVLDVRTLLAGGKIGWMKTAESWTSSLSGLGVLLSGNVCAKEQESGESYKDYLRKLLWLHGERTLNYRAMDLMELRAQVHSGKMIRMDAMILALRADVSYEAQPLFSEMVTIRKLQADRWEFSDSVYYSYFLKD